MGENVFTDSITVASSEITGKWHIILLNTRVGTATEIDHEFETPREAFQFLIDHHTTPERN